jgi:hypothetical protein
MTDDTALLERVRDALRADTRIGFDEGPIRFSPSNGDLVMEGEVADLSAKRRALRKAAEAIQGRFIVDRLHVRPAVPMEDGEIRDLVREAPPEADTDFGIADAVRLVCPRGRDDPVEGDNRVSGTDPQLVCVDKRVLFQKPTPATLRLPRLRRGAKLTRTMD